MKRKTFIWTEDENGCFNCTSHTIANKSYPFTSIGGKYETIARYIYHQCFGEIPEKYVVRHKCDNRSCINPEHLEIGTVQDNQNDMVKRNRQFCPKGELHGNSKVTRNEVIELRKLKGQMSSDKAGKIFGIAGRTVRDIWNRKCWQEV